MARELSADEAARQEALDHVERLDAAKDEDFYQFWGGLRRRATSLRNVCGIDLVTLPAALPLEFEVVAREVQASRDPETTKHMVGLLFGTETLDIWTRNGMDIDQFAVLLMWGTQNTRVPDSMSLADAYAEFEKRSEEISAAAAAGDGGEPDQGKAASAPRAAAAKTAPARGARSSATGRSSKRTSPASTA